MKNEAESEEYYKCFVPYCSNNNRMIGKSFRFFRVPAGIEGFHWKIAVNNARRKQYERMIELLKKNSQLNLKSHLTQAEYCCEVHFNIESDIEQILYEDGSVEYTVKPGSVPSIQAVQQTRIDEFDFEQLYNKVINQKVESNCSQKNDFVSLVDISTLTNRNEFDPQLNIKSEPMMPLTVALMKRKSVFYTGLSQSHLARLLFLTQQQTSLTEVMVMLTLRKLRLNEDLEVLGDLFDVDKTIAEKYLEDAKGLVLDLSETLTKLRNDLPNSIVLSNILETNCNAIKLEPMDSVDDYIDESEDHGKDVVEDEDTESDSSISVVKSEDDPDFDTSSLESSDSSECASDSLDEECASDSLDEESDESTKNLKSKSVCPFCDAVVFGLTSHIRLVHQNASNVNNTICGLCLKKFLSRRHLKGHQHDVHSGNGYSCDICGCMTRNYSQMKHHMSKKHEPIKDILCHLCAERFSYKHKLEAHIQRKHLRIRNYACHLCEKRYLDRLTLEEHIYAVHTGERPYKCNECGKAYARKETLNQHKNVHSDIRHSCDLCDKKFSFKQNLKVHKRNIHGFMI